jgi:glutathione peroxidase
MSSELYNFEFEGISGEKMPMEAYKGKVILLVNTASMCGFTKQYSGLQELYESYKEKNFVVLGVPSNSFMQEHSTEDKVKDFCETNFNITFPMTKIEAVIGNEKHPLYAWLKETHGIKPKWNFHKILIGKTGKVVNSYTSLTKPKSDKLLKVIEEEIKG